MQFDAFDRAIVDVYHNPHVDPQTAYPQYLQDVFSSSACEAAQDVIRQWPGYQATALRSFDGLALQLGLGGLYYKDESSRFGLGSFKALGGAYAVLRLLQRKINERTGEAASAPDIRAGMYANVIRDITVVTATDGNHGRSVAWGAQQFGCPCFIYMHAGVSQGRAKAVEAYGASVAWVEGNYDDSVRQAAADAAEHDWFVVSDTSYEGYTDVPRQVMAGYTVMTSEAAGQFPPGITPSHVFVQGGVGGLAGAICSHLWQIYGVRRPRCIVVEPDRADCLFQSAKNGTPTQVEVVDESIMAGLSCGEVSLLAWQLLKPGAHDFVTITDDVIAPAMRLLAEGAGSDPPLAAGETGVAGLAALIAVCRNPAWAQALDLDEDAHVLVLGTEGATDPDIYASLVGRSPGAVLASSR